jgi:DNA polymerase I-like protein with 3'-5' exonuclease and polymerase domains
MIVIDVETTMRSNTNFSATPFDPKNEMLSLGYTQTSIIPTASRIVTSYDQGMSKTRIINDLNVKDKPIVFIGHNIKFDLHYLVLEGLDLDQVSLAYDTQYMYYLLTGKKSPSLNDVADYYKLPRKKDTLSEYFSNNISIEDIPEKEMQEYLTQDISLTKEVFIRLWDDLCPELSPLVDLNAKLNMALQAMEMNGIYIDKEKLYHEYNKTDLVVEDSLTELKRLATLIYPAGTVPAKLHTTKTLNQIFRGKPVKTKEKYEAGVYKNGNIKFATREAVVYTDQPIVGDDNWTKKERANENVNLGLPMGEKQLQTIHDHVRGLTVAQKEYALQVIKYRKSSKLRDSFLKPIGDYLRETQSGAIHPTYNCTTTSTGRLSSTNPNAQNQPPEVEALFTTPTATGDSIVVRASADFKQLEIWAAAVLSGDSQLLEDIGNGVDIPDTIAASANLSGYKQPSVRRLCKVVLYGTIYGGYPAGLSKQTGWDKKIIQDIQAAFFDRYPGLKKYYDDYITLVNNSSPIAHHPTTGGAIVAIPSITGRIYRYTQYPQWDGRLDFNVPQLYNYRIQGFATGDVVPLYIACFLDTLEKNYSIGGAPICHLERTVHDQVGTRWTFPRSGLSSDKIERIIEGTYDDALGLTHIALKEWLPSLPELPLVLDLKIF